MSGSLPSVQDFWQRRGILQALLLPAGLLFGLGAGLRRMLYRLRLLRTEKLPVPVIVVGNVTVGGSGKTPLTLWLAEYLGERGLNPGIVSRGYGGAVRHPLQVTPASDPARVGDEPVLLARRSGCPVWVGADRAAAARALLAAAPQCNVIVTDDGLQHYRLARDFEIAVIDGERPFGNGWLLPAGPLREPPARLASVDAVVWNGEAPAPGRDRHFAMRLIGESFHNLLNPQVVVGPSAFHGLRLHAIAGIGNPARFFKHLRGLGLEGVSHPFPDHHAYRPRDLEFGDAADAILMTEKDAVKCAAFATERCWALAVDAEVDPRLGEAALRKLGK